MQIYKAVRKGTIWAGNNKGIARAICIILPIFMMLTGLWMGAVLFEDGYRISVWIPLSIVGVCLAVTMLAGRSNQKLKGKRGWAKRCYINRVICYGTYIYCAFLLSVCNGNMELNNKIYSMNDAWEDWTWYNTANDREVYAAVVYEEAARVDSPQNNSKERKDIENRNSSSNSQMQLQFSAQAEQAKQLNFKEEKTQVTTDAPKRGFIAMGVLFIIFAVLCAIGACAGFCVGGPLGTALGILASLSVFASIALSVVGFVSYKKSKRGSRGEKKSRFKQEKRSNRVIDLSNKELY